MSEGTSGHIIGGPVNIDYDGAVLTAALLIGDTALHVDDVADFDEGAASRGAALLLNLDTGDDGEPDASTGSAMAYIDCDDDASTVTLAAASTVAADIGDRVYLADPASGGLVGRAEVLVSIDDGDSSGDALRAYVDASDLGGIGDTDLNEMAVTLEEDEDGQLYVTGFPGQNKRPGAWAGAEDRFTLVAGTTHELVLTRTPIDHTEHVTWGINQDETQWSRTGRLVTIDDPDQLAQDDDQVVVKYLYAIGAAAVEVSAELPDVLGSDGGISGAGVGTYDVPISGATGGARILLATFRATAPGGWTLLQNVDAAGAGANLRVYAKTSDGTETSVTVTYASGEGSQRLGGIAVVIGAAGALTSAADFENPRVDNVFPAPAAAGTPVVSFAAYDGPGWPPDEHITGADTTMLENLQAEANGLYGLAAATDRATFTATVGASGSVWYAVTVGVVL